MGLNLFKQPSFSFISKRMCVFVFPFRYQIYAFMMRPRRDDRWCEGATSLCSQRPAAGGTGLHPPPHLRAGVVTKHHSRAEIRCSESVHGNEKVRGVTGTADDVCVTKWRHGSSRASGTSADVVMHSKTRRNVLVEGGDGE